MMAHDFSEIVLEKNYRKKPPWLASAITTARYKHSVYYARFVPKSRSVATIHRVHGNLHRDSWCQYLAERLGRGKMTRVGGDVPTPRAILANPTAMRCLPLMGKVAAKPTDEVLPPLCKGRCRSNAEAEGLSCAKSNIANGQSLSRLRRQLPLHKGAIHPPRVSRTPCTREPFTRRGRKTKAKNRNSGKYTIQR